jgi:hypothetical protein
LVCAIELLNEAPNFLDAFIRERQGLVMTPDPVNPDDAVLGLATKSQFMDETFVAAASVGSRPISVRPRLVLDINIPSAIIGSRPAPEVAAWIAGQPENALFTTTIWWPFAPLLRGLSHALDDDARLAAFCA